MDLLAPPDVLALTDGNVVQAGCRGMRAPFSLRHQGGERMLYTMHQLYFCSEALVASYLPRLTPLTTKRIVPFPRFHHTFRRTLAPAQQLDRVVDILPPLLQFTSV